MTAALRRVTVYCGLIAIGVFIFDRHYRFFDMAIYSGAVRWWLAGGDLYGYAAPVRGALGFTYPPFAALVLTPTAVVPVVAAGWAALVASLVALAAAFRTMELRVSVLVFVAVVATEPVRQTLGLGQVNLLLFALVVLDLAGLARAGSRWAGVGVGVAAAIKLTPGLFIVYLLVTRQWRAAATAGATFLGLTAAAGLIAPRETVQYFGDLLWNTARVGAADALANQSLTRLAGGPWLLVLCATAMLVGLRRAARAHTHGDEVTALALTGLTANLITPVAWTHHLVFLPVALLLLLRTHRKTALVCWALSIASPIWWAGEWAANTFVLMMIFLICRLPTGPSRDASGPADSSILNSRRATASPTPALGGLHSRAGV